MKDPFKKFQAKTYVLICILIMSVPGILEYGYQNTIPQMLLAVLTAGLLDLLINKLKKGPTYFLPVSGIISGLIVSTILAPGSVWYIPILGSMLVVFSKNVLRVKLNNFWNHIFNPANFALFVLIVLGIGRDAWWIGTNPILVAVLGLFVLWRLKKINIVVPFLIFYLLSTSVTILFTSSHLPDMQRIFTEISGGSFLFFMLIMIQEPMTAPRKQKSRIIFAALVGILGPLFLISPQIGFVSVYLSLIIGDLLVPLFNKIGI